MRAPWEFEKRARRPPPDPVNAVLSALYTMLQEQCRTAIVAAGLGPECGFLHADKAGRASLALDLMEEFRPVLADSVAWQLFNKRHLDPEDMEYTSQNGVRLTAEGWKVLCQLWEHRIESLVRIPGQQVRRSYRKLLEVQAWQIRRLIEGKIEQYKPYYWR